VRRYEHAGVDPIVINTHHDLCDHWRKWCDYGTANSTVHRCDFQLVGGGMADGGLSGTLMIERRGAESGGLDISANWVTITESEFMRSSSSMSRRWPLGITCNNRWGWRKPHRPRATHNQGTRWVWQAPAPNQKLVTEMTWSHDMVQQKISHSKVVFGQIFALKGPRVCS